MESKAPSGEKSIYSYNIEETKKTETGQLQTTANSKLMKAE